VLVEIYLMYAGIRDLNINTVKMFQDRVVSLQKKVVDKSKPRSYRFAAKQKMNHFKKTYEYRLGSMMIFFTRGIKPENLKKWTGKYFRFAMMLKLTLYEVLIVSLQQLPTTQITLLFAIQISSVLIIFKALFVDKIYDHKIYGVSDLITELTILFYFSIGLATSYSEEALDTKAWFLNAQRMQIYLILITLLINLVQVIYQGCLSIIHF
jgi:hypothetical protein